MLLPKWQAVESNTLSYYFLDSSEQVNNPILYPLDFYFLQKIQKGITGSQYHGRKTNRLHTLIVSPRVIHVFSGAPAFVRKEFYKKPLR